MPVTNAVHDLETRTLTITAEFAAPPQRIWQIYADPRQLEKIWGPPEFPATFVDHDFRPGGRVTYYMTGPGGEKYAGYWDMLTIDEPYSFTFTDGFADDDLQPNDDMPVSENTYTFTERSGGTVATYHSVYATAEGLQQVLDMGVIEGASSAIGQIDAFLAA
ncbi:SRPBCC family protein [Gordonia rhizosphera]|uniref:Activator of Hsp90 ATPase homologue 1/2-like C-terminal domain-containing protein n=1 Tax=Gordonia rhizosphera NBRC 16068 TaxID=1108045 RepID=K6VXV8_9ACTN|nr:SRPBCC domain-containing protein [Gordonia rhizosphera]GAB91740.1 hypothetical protein GORHZ_143_00070 [Gordonia rhizosphera NBRC 16068]